MCKSTKHETTRRKQREREFPLLVASPRWRHRCRRRRCRTHILVLICQCVRLHRLGRSEPERNKTNSAESCGKHTNKKIRNLRKPETVLRVDGQTDQINRMNEEQTGGPADGRTGFPTNGSRCRFVHGSTRGLRTINHEAEKILLVKKSRTRKGLGWSFLWLLGNDRSRKRNPTAPTHTCGYGETIGEDTFRATAVNETAALLLLLLLVQSLFPSLSLSLSLSLLSLSRSLSSHHK